MKTKYTSPIEIAAFKAGLTQGRIEGMLSYQKHLLNQIRKENEQLLMDHFRISKKQKEKSMIDRTSKNSLTIKEQNNEIREILGTIDEFHEWANVSYYVETLKNMTYTFAHDRDNDPKAVEDVVFTGFYIAEYITKLKENFDKLMELHPELVK